MKRILGTFRSEKIKTTGISELTEGHKVQVLHISYFKHIYTGYKFNKYIVLQFGPVKIKKPNELFTNKLDKNI